MITPSDRQLEVLHHTLGVTPERREPYRNHYVAGAGHHSQHILLELVAAGFMTEAPAPRFLADGDQVYRVTDVGRALALDLLPAPPKRSRYDEYLHSEYSESFAEWLCIVRPEIESSGYSSYYGVPDGHYRYRRREFTRGGHWNPEIVGEWKPTMKEAKASYKAALAKSKAQAKAFAANYAAGAPP